ncbi:MAG: 4-oxalocrotonate tautomerase [Candidatus Methylomirabilales bacterium]
MPVVHIHMLEGRSVEQKKQLAEAITAAFVNIANAKPEAVTVVIDDYPRTNWAKAGRLMSEPQ